MTRSGLRLLPWGNRDRYIWHWKTLRDPSMRPKKKNPDHYWTSIKGRSAKKESCWDQPEDVASRVAEQVTGMGLLSIVSIIGQQVFPTTSVTIKLRWRQRSADLVPDLTDLWSPWTSESGRSRSDRVRPRSRGLLCQPRTRQENGACECKPVKSLQM